MQHPNKQAMQRAITLAKENHQRGGRAVGAVLIKDNEIIAEGVATMKYDNDPTAHAEINAIRTAAKKLNSRSLDNCYLYSTFEPCPMCTSAAIFAKIKGIIYGANMEDENQALPQPIHIRSKEVLDKANFPIELYEDFQRADCQKLLL